MTDLQYQNLRSAFRNLLRTYDIYEEEANRIVDFNINDKERVDYLKASLDALLELTLFLGTDHRYVIKTKDRLMKSFVEYSDGYVEYYILKPIVEHMLNKNLPLNKDVIFIVMSYVFIDS
jgi:hypothetical protein